MVETTLERICAILMREGWKMDVERLNHAKIKTHSVNYQYLYFYLCR